MLAEHNRNVSHSRNISSHTANYILFSIQIALTPGIELGIIRDIVVTLGEQPGSFAVPTISFVALRKGISALTRLCHQQFRPHWEIF